jgi:formyltetrahydrofolate-dependent phosphoribosylglycinamide formyltransferase
MVSADRTPPARSSGERPGRLAVLVSGNGSNLQAIIDACRSGRLLAEIAVVVSNNPEAYALARATEAGIATMVKAPGSEPRRHYDAELAYEVATVGVDLVVLAGWDRLLSEEFVGRHTVINLHPAKPGSFPGLHAIERAYGAWQDGAITSSGVMVHYVPDEGVDDGPTIVWEEIEFRHGESLDTYETRVHDVEHRLIVQAIATVLDQQRLDPRIAP